jgi:hypothetical protein
MTFVSVAAVTVFTFQRNGVFFSAAAAAAATFAPPPTPPSPPPSVHTAHAEAQRMQQLGNGEHGGGTEPENSCVLE